MIEKTHTELSLNLLFAPKIDVESSESKLDHCNRPKKVNNIGIEHILSLILSQKPRHLTLTLETF